MATAVYYFNDQFSASDPDGAWTAESNAFDGSTATSASSSTTGSVSSNYVEGEGTNASSDLGTISSIRYRPYVGSTSVASSWRGYRSLTTPTGGWDWTKVQNLVVRFWYNFAADTTSPGIRITSSGETLDTYNVGLADGFESEIFFHRIEIEVTYTPSVPAGQVVGLGSLTGINSITF